MFNLHNIKYRHSDRAKSKELSFHLFTYITRKSYNQSPYVQQAQKDKRRVFLLLHFKVKKKKKGYPPKSIHLEFPQELYGILTFHPIPTFYTYTSMSISNGIKLAAKSGHCLYNIQYSQNP